MREACARAGRPLLVMRLVVIQVDSGGTVKAEGDHEAARRQVVEELVIALVVVELRDLDLVKVRALDSREVDVLRRSFVSGARFLFRTHDTLQHGDESLIVVGLTNEGVHQRGKVDLTGGEDGRLVILVVSHELIQHWVV